MVVLAVHEAIENKSKIEDLRKLLETFCVSLDQRVTYKSKWCTPLELAIETNNIDAVKLLLEFGATVNEPNRDYQTPLNLAVRSGHEGIIKLLLQYGANVQEEDRYNFRTVLKAFHLYWDKKLELDTLKMFLIDLKKDFFSYAVPYDYLLCEAVNKNDEAVLKIFADAKVYHFAPLREAVLNRKSAKIVKLVVNRNHINVNIHYEEEKLLHIAVRNRDLEVAKVLIDAGAHVNTENRSKDTPLRIALNNKDVPMIEFLLSRGAEMDDSSTEILQKDTVKLFETIYTEAIKIDQKVKDDKRKQDDLEVKIDRETEVLKEKFISEQAKLQELEKTIEDMRKNDGNKVNPLYLVWMVGLFFLYQWSIHFISL